MKELNVFGSWMGDMLKFMHVSRNEIRMTAHMGFSTIRKCLQGKMCVSVTL